MSHWPLLAAGGADYAPDRPNRPSFLDTNRGLQDSVQVAAGQSHRSGSSTQAFRLPSVEYGAIGQAFGTLGPHGEGGTWAPIYTSGSRQTVQV
jgi:hypothetical protein